MSTTPATITNYILETLRDDSNLSAIKTWFFGEPSTSQFPSSPWGWAEWTGGRQQPGAASNAMNTEDQFWIVIVVKHPNHEQGEEDTLSYVENTESALAADRTLDGKVAYSWISNREKQRPFNDRSIVAARLTLTTRRRKT